MPGFVREHLRPLLGSAALHLLLLVAVGVAAFRWVASPPPVPLAIEGEVVQYKDLPPSVRAGRALKEPAPPAAVPESKPEPQAEPKVEPQPEAEPAPPVDTAKEQAATAKAAEDKRKAVEARALERQQKAEAAAAAKREAEAKKQADAKRKAAEDEARKQAEAESRERQQAKEQAARDAKAKVARESELKKALAAEEAGAAVAQSGVIDEYRALLVQTIERNWIRPPSARAGLECTLDVTQATGGTVIDVKIGACNGDQAVRESITNAVYRSTPLPAPRDPRAFQRQLVIVFKPTE
jgi:colicin import membrane protein